MRSRRSRWLFVALALITNLGGGPMAWAHLAAASHCHGALPPPTQMPADCAEHQNLGEHAAATPAHSSPCCEGGACACATPPAPVTLTLVAPADLRHETRRAPLAARLFAADLLDDTLRPPIH